MGRDLKGVRRGPPGLLRKEQSRWREQNVRRPVHRVWECIQAPVRRSVWPEEQGEGCHQPCRGRWPVKEKRESEAPEGGQCLSLGDLLDGQEARARQHLGI